MLPPSWSAWRTLTVDAFRPEGEGASSLAIRVNGEVLPSQPVQNGWQRYTWPLPQAITTALGRAPAELDLIVDGPPVAPRAGRQRHPVRRCALTRDLQGWDARWRSMEKTMPVGPATVMNASPARIRSRSSPTATPSVSSAWV